MPRRARVVPVVICEAGAVGAVDVLLSVPDGNVRMGMGALDPRTNATISCVATNARLTKAEATKI